MFTAPTVCFSMFSTIEASNLHICRDSVVCLLSSLVDLLGVPPVTGEVSSALTYLATVCELVTDASCLFKTEFAHMASTDTEESGEIAREQEGSLE